MNAEISALIEKYHGESSVTLLYAIRCYERLVVAGLVTGPQALTAEAKADIERLLALGWTADPDEFDGAARYLAEHGLTECKPKTEGDL